MNESTSSPVDLSGKTVLVIDDDQRNVFAIQAYLERDGLEVLSEGRAADGLERIQSDSSIDLVLMDIKMPEMNGHEAIRAIRERLGRGDLPVIAVTGKTADNDRERSLEAGATDFITKPIDLERLAALLNQHLE